MLITNFARWKIVVGVLVYFVSTMAIARGRLNHQLVFSSDKASVSMQSGNDSSLMNGATPSANAVIQSDIIESDVSRLSVVHRKDQEDSIMARCNYESREDIISGGALDWECLNQFYQVIHSRFIV